jgi:hypothetical protein
MNTVKNNLNYTRIKMNKKYIIHLLDEINKRQKEILFFSNEIKKEINNKNKIDRRGDQ